MDFETILRAAESSEASDVIVKSNGIPAFKVGGTWQRPAESQAIPSSLVNQWAKEILPDRLQNDFNENGNVDFSLVSSGGRRFRTSLFRQQSGLSLVLRTLPAKPGRLDSLGIPSSFAKTILQSSRGLVLVTGITGSGKSSTISAILEVLNQGFSKHIVTIEDPIEILFKDERSTFQQREIGPDVVSFPVALRSALRQAPDIIFVGELRDRETVETAIHAADTGHLVMSTLHTKDAADSLGRLLSFFGSEEQHQLRKNLSETLLMTLSQRLLPRSDQPGLTVACEIMIVTSLIRKMVLEARPSSDLLEVIKNGSKYGMISFDQSILALFQQGIIDRDEALKNASSRNDMEQYLEGIL